MHNIHKLILSALILASLGGSAEACTAFQLKAKDGAYVYCRSMEYGLPLDSDLLVVPRETTFIGTAPNGQSGLTWKSKYGFVGMNQSIERKVVSDGMNEKGLVVGELYLPGFAMYEPFDDSKLDQTLGYWELAGYLLSTCATVQEVKEALATVLVPEQVIPITDPKLHRSGLKDFVMPLHFYVCDNSGNVLIIEYLDGKCVQYDNPLGVLTNSPPFDWQLTNLQNYIHLSPTNAPDLILGPLKLQSLGQGSGLLGLPGDYTPPSRFVKAAFFSQWAKMQKTAFDTVKSGFHILNTFDIFDGIIRRPSQEKKEDESTADITQWVIVHDRLNLKTYFRMYDTLRVQMVDLKAIDFSPGNLRHIPIRKDFMVEDVTTDVTTLK